MSQNNYGENIIDIGYQMNEDADVAEDQNRIVPPLNVNCMPMDTQGYVGYSAPVTGNMNGQMAPLPASHQGNNQSIHHNNYLAHQSVMSTMSKLTGHSQAVTLQASAIQQNDAHIRAALEIDHRFVDKNIHETLDRLT